MVQDKSHELGFAMNNAVLKDDIDGMEEFLSKGADLHYNSKGVNLPLFNAAFRGQVRAVVWLISKGADVSLLNHDPNDVDATPLMAAAFKGHRDIVETLVAAGADPCAASSNGKTASQFAREQKHTELAEYLVRQEYAVDVCNRWRMGERAVEEHFNFIRRERMTFVTKAGSDVVQAAIREGFDQIEESALRKAFDEHVRRGGRADEGSVFADKVVKSLKPCVGLG